MGQVWHVAICVSMQVPVKYLEHVGGHGACTPVYALQGGEVPTAHWGRKDNTPTPKGGQMGLLATSCLAKVVNREEGLNQAHLLPASSVPPLLVTLRTTAGPQQLAAS